MQRVWIVLGVLFPLLGLLACRPAGSAEREAFPRATMAEIAESLSRALPLSLDPERLRDPAQRERFGATPSGLPRWMPPLTARALTPGALGLRSAQSRTSSPRCSRCRASARPLTRWPAGP